MCVCVCVCVCACVRCLCATSIVSTCILPTHSTSQHASTKPDSVALHVMRDHMDINGLGLCVNIITYT